MAKYGNVKGWFTIKGVHVPILEGETKAQAASKYINSKHGKTVAKLSSKKYTKQKKLKYKDRDDKELHLKESEYYYHNTKKSNLENIKKEGLKPTKDVGYEKGLFFGEYFNREENQVYGDVELRVYKNHVSNPQTYIGNLYTNTKVDAKWLQVKNKTSNKWEWLNK